MKADKLPVPVTQRPEMGWGSDVIAEVLHRLDIPYLSFVPGASYRGLHDSLVNYLGNTKPEMVLCLHEEHAVAVAQGYAKVTGRPMAVALHSNVGLMHATMAIFDAYCDRVPMLIIGATGPLDATQRRPWIDWIHTAADQGALIRDYCKWDDQPGSVTAAAESLIRADKVTREYPSAPVYVCLDAGMQEERLPGPVSVPDTARYGPAGPPAPDPEQTGRCLDLLRTARRPLVLFGRGGREDSAWDDRVALVERLGACALTDLKTSAVFPAGHPRHPATPGMRLTPSGLDLMRRADVILSLDWIDLAGTLAVAFGDHVTASVISCSNDGALHNGWSKDHFALPVTDVAVCAHPDLFVRALLAGLPEAQAPPRDGWPGTAAASRPSQGGAAVPDAGAVPDGRAVRDGADPDGASPDGASLTMPDLAAALRQALAGSKTCWVSLARGWPGDEVETDGPLSYLGKEGGGGVGSGPGVAVGAALALHGTGRVPVAVLGDGDYLMGNSALWTAAHHRLPLLVVVANNRSYFNDEVHQERMARMRARPAANRTVGQHIREPDPDLAMLACSLGLRGYGPVHTRAELTATLEKAVADVAAGDAAVVDVRVNPAGDDDVPGNTRGTGP